MKITDWRRAECRLSIAKPNRQLSIPNGHWQSAVCTLQSAMGELSLTQQLPVLLLLEIVEQSDVLIGDLLDLVEALSLVVFGDLVVLEEFLEPVVGVAAHLAYAVAPFLGELVHQLRHLLAPLLGERGQRDAHDFAVVGRVEAEIGAADRLLDRAE